MITFKDMGQVQENGISIPLVIGGCRLDGPKGIFCAVWLYGWNFPEPLATGIVAGGGGPFSGLLTAGGNLQPWGEHGRSCSMTLMQIKNVSTFNLSQASAQPRGWLYRHEHQQEEDKCQQVAVQTI